MTENVKTNTQQNTQSNNQQNTQSNTQPKILLNSDSKDTRTKVREFCFYLALIIELVLVIADKSALTNPYVSYFFRATFLLTTVTVLLTKYTKRQWLVVAFAVILGVVSYRMSGRNEVLRFVMFMAACKEIDMKRALIVSFYVTLAGCILITLLSISGIFGAIGLSQDYGRNEGVTTRYTLGFGHPNSLQCMFFVLMLLGMYIYDNKMKWYGYLILFISNIGIYLLTDSRTGFVLAAAAIVAMMIVHYTRLRESVITFITAVLVLIGSVGFSVWAAVNSKDCWKDWMLVDKIDHKLNGRIVQLYWQTNAHEGAFETWTLFSNRNSQAYFDMGIVRLFYWYGIIPAVIAILVLVIVLFECYKKRDGLMIVIISTFCVYSIVEAHFISQYIGRNFCLIVIGAYLLGNTYLCSGRTRKITELIGK